MPAIALDKIRTDGGTQTRAGIDRPTVDSYRDAMESGDRFPAVVVFHDGRDHWLGDGFHRYLAAAAAGKERIEAEVRQGTQRDAILYSVGANATHGLRRTNADKRRAVEMLLRDDEWSQWSDRVIADKCGVSNRFVGVIRSEVHPTVNRSQLGARQGADGKYRGNGTAGGGGTPKPLPGQADFFADDPGFEDEPEADDDAGPASTPAPASDEGDRRWIALWERMAEQMISIHRAGGFARLVEKRSPEARRAIIGCLKRHAKTCIEWLKEVGETP